MINEALLPPTPNIYPHRPQNDVKSQNKAKAVSEMVSKMAAAPKSRTSTRNKKPPSAEEAKRIAKIFSNR